MLYSVMAHIQEPAEARWLPQSMAAADWWLANVPDRMVAFWDFNDPAIPNIDSDTAATAMVCAAMLKLAEVATTENARKRFEREAVVAKNVVHPNVVAIHEVDHIQGFGRFDELGGCF